MGASASKEEVASHVLEIGTAYENYASAVKDNGIDGKTLAGYDNVKSLFADLEITPNNLHLNRMERELHEQRTTAAPTAVAVTGPSLTELTERASLINLKKIGVPASEVFHMFISYRQKTERGFALDLYNGIRARVADKDFGIAGTKPRPFLDLKCLEDGKPWQTGFVDGVFKSLMMVPLVTWTSEDSGSVAPMAKIDPPAGKDWCDNVLLEWELALAIQSFEYGILGSIFPVMHGGFDERGFLPFPFENLAKLPTVPSLKTKEMLVKLCEQMGVPLSEEAVQRSVQGVVRELMQNQGVKLSELGVVDVATACAVTRTFDKGSEVLLQYTKQAEAGGGGGGGGAGRTFLMAHGAESGKFMVWEFNYANKEFGVLEDSTVSKGWTHEIGWSRGDRGYCLGYKKETGHTFVEEHWIEADGKRGSKDHHNSSRKPRFPAGLDTFAIYTEMRNN